MSWTDTTATGIGGDGVEFRLVVEGGKYEVCTDGLAAGDCYEDASILPAAGSETWATDGGTITVTTGQSDPLGGTDAASLAESNTSTKVSACTSGTHRSGTDARCEVWLKRDDSATHTAAVETRAGGTGSAFVSGGVVVHLGSGECETYGTGYSEPECVEAISGWWRVRFTQTGAGLIGTTLALRVRPAYGLAASFPANEPTATGTTTVYGPAIYLADGRRRVHGLARDSVGFTESAYLAGAKINVGITPARIIETPGPTDLDAMTEMFTGDPAPAAWLAANLSDWATSATVRGTLTAGECYHVGTEVIRVDTVGSTSSGVTTLSAITRGMWGTTAQAHFVEATDSTPAVVPMREWPSTWAGRRVWVYAHGADELDRLDGGSLIYRGVVSSDPQLEGGDATTWILNLSSRWTITEQEIGAGNDKTRRLAGAYYPGNHAFQLSVTRSADANQGGNDGTGTISIAIAGHYASNEAFGEAVAAALNADALSTTWGIKWGSVVHNGRWELTVKVGLRYIMVSGGSPVDGFANSTLRSESQINSPHIELPGVASGGVYIVNFRPFLAGVPESELRRLPRSVNTSPVGEVLSDTAADLMFYPDTRLYLDSVRGLATNSTLTISQRANADGEEPPPHDELLSSVTSAGGYVTCGVTPRVLAVGDWTHEITVTTRISRFSATGDTLEDFRDRLLSLAPDEANSGLVPFLTSDDVADWTEVVDELAAHAPEVLATRLYLYTTGVRLSDILQAEAQLLGAFFYLDADGKIALRPLTIYTGPIADDHVLSDVDGSILDVDGFGQLTSGDDGNVNVVEIHKGYDPTEDKHTRGTTRVRSVEGMSEAKKERVVEIKPKAMSRREIDSDQAQRLAGPILSLFGGKIHHYTFAVPLTRFGVLVGDTVRVSCSTLPYAGARARNASSGGLASVRALVVSRDWSEIASGVGRLTVLVTSGMSQVAGYSPSGRVDSATGSTTSWTLTLQGNYYSPSGEVDASYFVAGDRVRLLEWDAASPTERVGTVDSVSGNDVAVTLDASWAGLGGATYILVYAQADESDTRDEQYDYCAIAASNLQRITSVTSGTSGPARVFAP